jgi:hypothetical protein
MAKRAFFGILTNPHTRAYYAAMYEAEQAQRDFSEVYHAAKPHFTGHALHAEYGVWHAGGYADAADRAVRDLPVWEANPS